MWTFMSDLSSSVSFCRSEKIIQGYSLKVFQSHSLDCSMTFRIYLHVIFFLLLVISSWDLFFNELTHPGFLITISMTVTLSVGRKGYSFWPSHVACYYNHCLVSDSSFFQMRVRLKATLCHNSDIKVRLYHGNLFYTGAQALFYLDSPITQFCLPWYLQIHDITHMHIL